MLKQFVIFFFLVATLAGHAHGQQTITDPQGLFEFALPSGWVFQAQQSSDSMLVYMNSGKDRVFYTENRPSRYQSLEEAKTRILDVYASEWGLKEFVLLETEADMSVDGQDAVQICYQYVDEHSYTIKESRIIVLVEDTLVSAAAAAAEEDTAPSLLEDVLESWRWLNNAGLP